MVELKNDNQQAAENRDLNGNSSSSDEIVDEWANLASYKKELGLGETALRNRLKGLDSVPGLDSLGRPTPLYRKSEVLKVTEDLLSRPVVDKKSGVYVDLSNGAWAPARWCVLKFGVAETAIRPRTANVRSMEGRDKMGRPTVLFNVSDMERELSGLIGKPRVDESSSILSDESGAKSAPLTWFTRLGICKETLSVILRDVTSTKGRVKGRPTNLYNVDEAQAEIERYFAHKKEDEESKERKKQKIEPERLWVPVGWLAKKYGLSGEFLKSIVAGVIYVESKGVNGQAAVLYSVREASVEIEKVMSKPKVDRVSGDHIDDNGECWTPYLAMSQRFGISPKVMLRKINENGARSIEGRDKVGRPTILYSVSDVSLFMSEFSRGPKARRTDGIYTDENNASWATIQYLSDKYGFPHETTRFLISGVTSIKGRDRINKPRDLYSLGEAEQVLSQVLSRPQTDPLNRTYQDQAGECWIPGSVALEIYGLYPPTLANRAKEGLVRTINGRTKRDLSTTLFCVSDIERIVESQCYEKPPEGWMTVGSLMPTLRRGYSAIKDAAEKFRETHPEWFKIYVSGTRSGEHYSPELILEIGKALEKTQKAKTKENVSPEEANQDLDRLFG